MANGIVRKIDELGRITIPKEIRDTFGFSNKAKLGMNLVGDTIHLFQVDKDFKGFARRLDTLGRWTLPIETRIMLHCDERQKIDISVQSTSDTVVSAEIKNNYHILIRKEGCTLCGNDKDLLEVDGKQICLDCAVKIIGEVYKHRSDAIPAQQQKKIVSSDQTQIQPLTKYL